MTVIEELMKTDLVTASPDDKVQQVAAQMDQNRVGAVMVLDSNGELFGLFSERDLVSKVVAAGLDPGTTSVSAVATRDPVTVGSTTHVRECAELLRDRGFRHLPVLRDGKPAGIVSARDLFASVAQGLEAYIDRARYANKLDEGEDPYDHVGGSYSR